MEEKKSRLAELIRQFLEELDADIVEERVVDYIIKGIQDGRELRVVLSDPYITNRVGEGKLERLISDNPEIIETVEKQLKAAFEKHDFKFSE